MIKRQPKIAVICGTYKRPTGLANAYACFRAQTYPQHLRKLFVMDDAGEHLPEARDDLMLFSTKGRFATLPDKAVATIKLANELWKPDAYAIMDDDDVFLPWHLEQMGDAFLTGTRFFRLPKIWSTFNHFRSGRASLVDRNNGYYPSIGFTREIYEQVGGHVMTDKLIYDQLFMQKLADVDPNPPIPGGMIPSFVYRWCSFNNGNVSNKGEAGFRERWEEMGALPCSPIPIQLQPQFDQETIRLYEDLT